MTDLRAADCKSKYMKYVKDLVKYIKENSRKYQVAIILNTEMNSANEIVLEIVREVPGFVMKFKKSVDRNKLSQLTAFNDPQKTTIFIVIGESYSSKSRSGISEIFDFLSKLSPVTSRPKSLLISLTSKKSYSYEKLLRHLWSQRFLDVTILQFREEIISKNELTQSHQVKATLHHFNPFTDVYKKTKFSRKMDWFPDKLRDMNGFPIKGGLMNLPPYSIVKFDDKNQPVSYSGAEYLTFMTLSKALNFSATIITSHDAKIGVEDVKNKTATGMIGKCVSNEINIFITTLMPLNTKKEGLTETTRMLELSSLYAIIPSLPSEDVEVQHSLLYTTMLAFFSIVILIYIASRLLKFSKFLWYPEKIVQILLGVSVPNQPIATHERIVFIVVILVGFSYASTFFAGITSKNLKVSREMEFNNFEDLDDSGLRVVVHPNLISKVFGSAEGALLNLQKKSFADDNLMTTCIRDLIKYKNTSCILAGCTAIDVVESHKDQSGHSPVKIMKQAFWSTSNVMYMERGSPFVKRFDEVLIRIIEAGLRQKWTGHYYRDLSALEANSKEREISDFENLGGVTNLRRRLVFIALHGFLLSFIVFVGELLLYHWKKIYFGIF